MSIRVSRHAVYLLALLGLSACLPQPVEWAEETRRRDGIVAESSVLVLDADAADGVQLVPQWTPPAWPEEPSACTATRRATRALGEEAYASWFTVRADSSVLLRVARSDDGGHTWQPAVTADSLDVGRAGCARPVPYIAADSLNGYVHLVYFLDAREGAGVFFTHTMERGALFHEPVPIVYGDRPSQAAVASRGDTVIVAYEDPNSRLPRLGLALSRVQGHIFEHRIPASDETGEARTPRVALRGTQLVVAWTATSRGGTSPRTAIRAGTLTW
ncbi:hypothetical protein Strain138_002796 [Pseudogemmatithrix spongiicola]|uniref:Exo-alpha-sialidase n=1 Tax=Pseudogemmatithrix spongiicola TaxID=3062599 RepID=A0AA49JX31_9BACT|nr:hypothetical protein Strain138_002796 [Gemmatimonadaceae bacterium 'strain 138']WKW16382.1 hypothetical protein Strain318_002796 [Gemmatimonadaceae bacterium 'strain 318']